MRITIDLKKQELKELRDIARTYGFEIDRGRLVGEGSIRQMLLAMAKHEYKLVRLCSVEGCENQVIDGTNLCSKHMQEYLNEVPRLQEI